MASKAGSAGAIIVGMPFPAVRGLISAPTPTGTGMGGVGIFGVAGISLSGGGGVSGLKTGLYGANEERLGLPAPLFMKTPGGLDQEVCSTLLGILGGMALACSLAAFCLRRINKATITPDSNSPSRIAMVAAINGVLSDELVVGAPVLLPSLLLDVELLPAVGDALTVDVAPAVAVALAVTVALEVGVTLCVTVGEGVITGVGDGLGVAEGGTTSA